MKQYGELVVECDGLLTGVLGGVILVETLRQGGCAFGTGTLLRRLVGLVNGRIGFALSLMQHLEEVTKLMEIIRYPQGHVARGLVAGHKAQAPIRGHASAAELMLLKRFKMCSPGVSRPIGGQLNVEDRGAARIDGDQDGGVDGENFIAEIKHERLCRHTEGGRKRLARAVEELTERADGIGLVVQRF